MESDKLFEKAKEMNERELYRQSIRNAMQQHQAPVQPVAQVASKKRLEIPLAKGILTFMVTLLSAPLLAFMLLWFMEYSMPTWLFEFSRDFGGSEYTLLFMSAAIFAGIYAGRLAYWTLKNAK